MRKNLLEKGKGTRIESFFGVGEKRAEAFHKMGIFTAEDAVYRFPRAYEPRGNLKTTATAEDGEVCSLILTVATEPKNAMIRKGMTLTKFTAFDEDGTPRTVKRVGKIKALAEKLHAGAAFSSRTAISICGLRISTILK
jgi:RecG-like helicase